MAISAQSCVGLNAVRANCPPGAVTRPGSVAMLPAPFFNALGFRCLKFALSVRILSDSHSFCGGTWAKPPLLNLKCIRRPESQPDCGGYGTCKGPATLHPRPLGRQPTHRRPTTTSRELELGFISVLGEASGDTARRKMANIVCKSQHPTCISSADLSQAAGDLTAGASVCVAALSSLCRMTFLTTRGDVFSSLGPTRGIVLLTDFKINKS